jgi:hypothetical protein
MAEEEYSDYIVYVDESGHAAPEADPNYPCFVLALCLFEKSYYCENLAPALQRLKFQFFGHDMAIMHEREIRKSLGPFAILKNSTIRRVFFSQLSRLITDTTFSIIYHVIRKDVPHPKEDNLYHVAAQHCLESLYAKLVQLQQHNHITHVVFEERGKKEDHHLELEFRRICAGENKDKIKYPFVPIFASKKANSSGLQFADLVARPIGQSVLYPEQENRAFDIIKTKDIHPTLTQQELNLP